MKDTITTIRALASTLYGEYGFTLDVKRDVTAQVKSSIGNNTRVTYSLNNLDYFTAKDICNVLRRVIHVTGRDQS